jgi:hypothetical protein
MKNRRTILVLIAGQPVLTSTLHKTHIRFFVSLILKSYLHSRHFLEKVETKYIELSSVNGGVPKGSVLGQLLYLLYTEGLPTSLESITANFADDTAVLATDSDPVIASHKLQTNLLALQNRSKNWRMKANGYKSIHVTFTTRREMCSFPVHINNANFAKKKIPIISCYTL